MTTLTATIQKWTVENETYEQVSQRWSKALKADDPAFEFTGSGAISPNKGRIMILTAEISVIEE
jgi:hypothetical protein